MANPERGEMDAFCRIVLVVAVALIVGRWFAIPADDRAADGPRDRETQQLLATSARNSTWAVYETWSGARSTTPLSSSLLRAEQLYKEAQADPTVPRLRSARHAFDEVLYCMNHGTCEELIRASEEASHVCAFRACAER